MTTPHSEPYTEPFFTPDPKSAARSRIADFARWAARHRGAEGIQDPTDYRALHQWSVTDLEGFWAAVWEYFDIDATTEYERVLAEETMPGARWFPASPSTTPITRCATCSRTLPRSPPWTRPGPGTRSRAGSCAPGSPLWLLACATWASDRATGWWAICPTPPTPSLPSWPPQAWARCGRCAARTTRPGPPPTASPSSNPRCSSPLTATSSTARPTTAAPPRSNSLPPCRR